MQNNVEEQVLGRQAAMKTVSERLNKAGSAFRGEAGGFKESVADALALMEEVGERFYQQKERLTSASVQAGMQMSDNQEGMKALSETLSKSAEEAAKTVQMISDAFASQSGRMGEEADKVRERLTSLTDLMKAQSEELSAAGDLSHQKVSKMASTLDEQTQNLNQSSERATSALHQAATRAQASAKQLAGTVKKAAAEAEESIVTFDSQTEKLLEAADRAGDKLIEIKGLEESAQKGRFLKTVRYVLEDLNSTAIDLTRIMDADVPETEWKRYVKGDRGVFTRAILRQKPTAVLTRIQARMQEDSEARAYILRYVQQFDKLLRECQKSDPENLMESTLLTADVGKLYILLKQALGED